ELAVPAGAAPRALDAADVRGAGPLGAVHYLELYAVTLVESAEPFRPDLRVVDEHVRTTLAGKKTESLGLVDPLDGTCAPVDGAAGAAARPRRAAAQDGAPPARAARLRSAAIGLNHGHINGQVDSVIRGGGELASFYAKEPDLAAAFSKRFPQARLARSEREI